jgi:hypothetical protein
MQPGTAFVRGRRISKQASRGISEEPDGQAKVGIAEKSQTSKKSTGSNEARVDQRPMMPTNKLSRRKSLPRCLKNKVENASGVIWMTLVFGSKR